MSDGGKNLISKKDTTKNSFYFSCHTASRSIAVFIKIFAVLIKVCVCVCNFAQNCGNYYKNQQF